MTNKHELSEEQITRSFNEESHLWAHLSKNGCSTDKLIFGAAMKAGFELGQKADGWISVDERLPEPETEVMIHPPVELADWHRIALYSYQKGGGLAFEISNTVMGYEEIYIAEHITHWQPLPQPPGERK